MERKLLIIILSCMLLTLLSACMGQTYGSTNQKQAEAKGREEVTEFLNANLPDAKLLSVKAVEANREMTLTTLTNYVCGEYESDFSKYDYYFDLNSGRMYSGKDFYVLRRLIEDRVLRDLNLPDTAEVIFSDIRLYLPDMVESSAFNDDVGSGEGKLPEADSLMPLSAPVLPFEALGDIEGYFHDEGRKELYEVRLEIVLKPEDDFNLEDLHLKELLDEEEAVGIYFHSLIIHNAYSVEYSRVGNENKAEVVDLAKFRKYGEYPGNGTDFTVYEVYHVTESADSATESIVYRRKEFFKNDSYEIKMEEEYFD